MVWGATLKIPNQVLPLPTRVTHIVLNPLVLTSIKNAFVLLLFLSQSQCCLISYNNGPGARLIQQYPFLHEWNITCYTLQSSSLIYKNTVQQPPIGFCFIPFHEFVIVLLCFIWLQISKTLSNQACSPKAHSLFCYLITTHNAQHMDQLSGNQPFLSELPINCPNFNVTLIGTSVVVVQQWGNVFYSPPFFSDIPRWSWESNWQHSHQPFSQALMPQLPSLLTDYFFLLKTRCIKT